MKQNVIQKHDDSNLIPRQALMNIPQMKRIIYNRDGLKIEDQIPPSLHGIKNVTKDDLIECLVTGETSSCSDYRPDANTLKSLIHDIDNLEQFVSYEKIRYSDEVAKDSIRIHFLKKGYISIYNIKPNNSFINFSDCIRTGNFFISDLITAKIISIDELVKTVEFPIDPYRDFIKGEPTFDYPIHSDLYYIGNNTTICFPFTEIIRKRKEELNLDCYLSDIDYSINYNDNCIEFTFYSEKNTGRHWYTTTEYNGKINLHDLSVDIKEGASSSYKF